MKKRDFIRLMGLGAAGITLGSPLVKAHNSFYSEPLAPYWIWMSDRDASSSQWDDRFKKLADLGIKGILIRASEEKYIEIGPIARSAGLEIHAWIIVLNHRSEETIAAHPEWYTVSRDGKSTAHHPPYVGYYSWLCPTRTEVAEFVSARVKRLASIDGLDGIHLDYIRHSDVILPVGLWSKYNLVQDKEYPEFDFCYCDACRKAFEETEGIDPLDLEDPSSNQAWLQFRYDSVTRLVNQLAVITKQNNKKLTAAVFPTPDIAKRLVRQEWIKWDLDAVFPMIYHNFYEKDIAWIETATREGIEALGGKSPLYSGLYIPALSPGNIAEAVEFALAGGAAGVTFFNEESMNRKFWRRIS